MSKLIGFDKVCNKAVVSPTVLLGANNHRGTSHSSSAPIRELDQVNLNSSSAAAVSSYTKSQATDLGNGSAITSLIDLIQNSSKEFFKELKILVEISNKDHEYIIEDYQKLDILFQTLNSEKYFFNVKRNLIILFTNLCNNGQSFPEQTLDTIYNYLLNNINTESWQELEAYVEALKKFLDLKINKYLLSPDKINLLNGQLAKEQFSKELKENIAKLLLDSSNNLYDCNQISETQYYNSRTGLLVVESKLHSETVSLQDLDNHIALFGGDSELENLRSIKAKLKQDKNYVVYGRGPYCEDGQNAFNMCNCPNYLYKGTDIKTIQNTLMQPYSELFTIHEPIGDDIAIDHALSQLLNGLNADKPTLCVYNLGNFHWVSFAALKQKNNIVVLYKDSLGSNNPELEATIKQLSNSNEVQFIANTKIEQKYGVDCGIFALSNMHIMAEKLSSNKDVFIKGFQQFTGFCSLTDAEALRKGDFANQYVLGNLAEMAAESIKISKLQQLRMRHAPELEEIKKLLETSGMFNSISIKTREFVSSLANIITIEIQSIPDEDLSNNQYRYNYRISLSHDLDIKFLENITSCLGLTQENIIRDKNFIVVSEGGLEGIKKVAKQGTNDSEIPVSVNIGDLIGNLSTGLNSAPGVLDIITKSQQSRATNIRLVNNLEQLKDDLSEIDYQLGERTREINNLQEKQDKLKVININDLLVVFAEKLKSEDAESVQISSKSLDKITEVGKTTNNKEVAQAVLDILSFASSEQLKAKELESCLGNILPKIDATHESNIASIKNLAEAIGYPALLVDTFHNILLESLDDPVRNKTLDILNSWQQKHPEKLVGSVARTIDLINLVKRDRDNATLIGLIKEIGGRDEKLPAYFLQDFKKILSEQSNLAQDKLKEIVTITKALVEGNYISLKDVVHINSWLDNEELCDDALDIISKCIQQRTVTDGVLDKVKAIAPSNTRAAAIINNLDRLNNKPLSLLMNPRIDLSKRQEVLGQIEFDANNHLPYVFSSLANIVKYEPELRDEAYKVLAAILPNHYDIKDLKLDSDAIALASVGNIITLANKNNNVDLADLSLFSEALIQKMIFQDCSAKEIIDATEDIPVIQEKIKKYLPSEVWDKIKEGNELIIDINCDDTQTIQRQRSLELHEGESTKELLCRRLQATTCSEEMVDEFALQDFISSINFLESLANKSNKEFEHTAINDNPDNNSIEDILQTLVSGQLYYEENYEHMFSLQEINCALAALQASIASRKLPEIKDCQAIITRSLHASYVKRSLEIKLGNQLEAKTLESLTTKLSRLLDCNWVSRSLDKLVDVIDKDNAWQMLSALDPIYEYGLREYETGANGCDLIDILANGKNTANWQKQIHDIAVFQVFKGSYDKNLDQLKSEILSLNTEDKISILQNDKFIKEYEEVIKAYTQQSKQIPVAGIIENWTEENIKSWAEKVKAAPDSADIYEKVAVVKRAVELTSKFPPRAVQMLALMIMLNPERGDGDKLKGRLAQVNTGEGKTTIVAMLAAIKALEGHQVDIVTSSPELACPQAEEQSKFFEKFGFTTAHNGEDDTNIEARYKADIVYGAANNFQGDILRDEYTKLGTRSDRKCDVAIVDEVDSMLIDGRNHIVMLSSPMPSMDHLEPLLAAIWIQIGQAASLIIEQGGKAYYLEQEDVIGEDGKVVASNLTNASPIDGTKEQFIKDCTEKHIRKMLRDYQHLSKEEVDVLKEQDKKLKAFEEKLKVDPICKDTPPDCYPKIQIPEHLRKFVTEVQLTKWIDSAITAKYRYELNKQYILDNNQIRPVDASNTGVVQQNMHWSNGLHQFLQIKHGTKITAESLTTNFISNVTYFQRYGSNIYGLTGTLGSDKARELLNETYKVDSVVIPPFKQKQYHELAPVITNSVNEWYETIADSSLNKLKNGRGVLVITKYMEEVDQIKQRLIDKGYDESKIKVYKDSSHSNVTQEELKSGEIIIATNIAGRGTDIKPSEQVEKNGGLHVCVTFMPPNQRVEWQNVGRTSRTGNKGTGQFILLERTTTDIQTLKEARDVNEEQGLEDAKQEIKKTTVKDAVFAEFCQLLDIIDKEGKRRDDPLVKLKIRTIEDRFAIWLRMQETKNTDNNSTLLDSFKSFSKTIQQAEAQDKLVNNPYFHVLKANQLLESDSEDKYKTAIEEYTKAIEKDPHFAANAYYNRGYARVAGYCGEKDFWGSKHDEYDAEVGKAIEDFKEAKRIIEENLEPMLNLIQKASYSEVLSEQVQHKVALFEMQKNAIESAIGIGEKGMKALKADEDKKLNARINEPKLNAKKQELIAKQLSESEITQRLAEFAKTLSQPTEEQRAALREQDLIDSIKAEKIAKTEASINERLKNARKKEDIRYDDEFGALDEDYEDVKREEEALKNLASNKSAKNETEKKLYSQLQPTTDEINQRKNELRSQQEILEHGVIGKAYKKKRALEIEFIEIKKSLPEDQDASLYKEEIQEFRNNGFKGAIQVKEVKPIDWASVAGLAAIGLAQIVAGAALAVFTCGAGSSIGLGLISEGIGDIITAVKDGIINRDFDWTSYGIQKAISLTVSVACAGLGAIKDVAKTAAAGAKAVAGAAQAGKIAMTQTTKEGVKLAAKAVGTSVAKGVAKEIVTELANYGIDKALMPSIREEVMKRIEGPIQEALMKNENVLKMLELDGKNRNKYYQSLIKQTAMKLLNPQSEKDHALVTITKGIAKGIACNKVKGLSQAMQLAEAMGALNELNEFVPKFINKLNSKIENITEKQKVNEKLEQLKKEGDKDKNETKDQKQSNKAAKGGSHTFLNDAPSCKSDKDIDLKRDGSAEKQATLSRETKSPEELKKALSSSISVNMCNIIQSKLISPLAHTCIDHGLGKLTEGMDKSLQDAIGNYQAERRIEFLQNGDKDNRVGEEFKPGICPETEHKADSIIKDLENGGEAGLPHLGALSEEAGRPIKVLDEKGRHVRTIGGDKGGDPIEVQYHKPNPNNPSGHWTLPGGKEAPVSGKNNCLFDAVAAQTGKDPSQLRAGTANRMETNKEFLANQAHDIMRLEQYKKDALQIGGVNVNLKQNGKDITTEIDNEILLESLKKMPAGTTLVGGAALSLNPDNTIPRDINDFDFIGSSDIIKQVRDDGIKVRGKVIRFGPPTSKGTITTHDFPIHQGNKKIGTVKVSIAEQKSQTNSTVNNGVPIQNTESFIKDKASLLEKNKYKPPRKNTDSQDLNAAHYTEWNRRNPDLKGQHNFEYR